MTESVRLDKWLWAARFFKTRSMATDAINGGKVHVNGQRVKPARAAKVGDILRINKSPQVFEVEILALSDKRQSAPIAQTLYAESAESIEKREQESQWRKLANAQVRPAHSGRPTKRERRQITAFMRDKRNTFSDEE